MFPAVKPAKSAATQPASDVGVAPGGNWLFVTSWTFAVTPPLPE